MVVAGGDDVIHVDSEIGLAALDLGKNLKAHGLDRSHLHVGVAPLEFCAACHASFELGPADSIELRRLAPYPLLSLDSSFTLRKTSRPAILPA